MKKILIKLSAVALTITMLILSIPLSAIHSYAESKVSYANETKEKYQKLSEDEDIYEENKDWIITLSENIHPDSINNKHIFVKTHDNKDVSVKVEQVKNNPKQIKINHPDGGYQPDIRYTIFVKELKSYKGDTLKENVDRKSTRLNSSHANISYAVFCL